MQNVFNSKYNIIYCDPPWSYDNNKSNNSKLGGKTYELLTLEELKAININKIADRNCLLFMWVTMPKILDAMIVINSWGFEFVTVPFVWIKLNRSGCVNTIGKSIYIQNGIYSGLGHWTNGNAEFIMLARKGKAARIKKDIKQIVFEPIQNHSEKPEVFRMKIHELVGRLPSVELFARKQSFKRFIDGWKATGLDYDGLNILEYL